MNHANDDKLNAERDALIQEIYAAFAGVTLGKGVSWAQCEAMDPYRSEAEIVEARGNDTDTDWNQLVDDPNWRPFPGVGGFAFIDPLGFRYYLAPSMIRAVREEYNSDCHLHFYYIERHARDNVLFNPPQMACIARFIFWMTAAATAADGPHDNEIWEQALHTYWRQFLPNDHLDKNT